MRALGTIVAIGLLVTPLYGQTFAISDARARERATSARATREVVVAPARDGRVLLFDSSTLEPIASYEIGTAAERARASADGRTLYVAKHASLGDDEGGCCGLYALDLAGGGLKPMIAPAVSAAPSADGRWVFTQRGNVGVDVFDVATLERAPAITAPGVYALHPSPDGRSLFGTTSWAGPSLDLIDTRSMQLVRRLAIPEGLSPRGAWIGDTFYAYAHDGRRGLVWSATVETTSLGSPVEVALPALANGGARVWQEAIAAGRLLALYEPFGSTLDRRSGAPPGAIPGGVYLVDPRAGRFVRHLAPEIYFASVGASVDGRYVYGLEAKAPGHTGPRHLMKIETASGRIVAARELAGDVASISVGSIDTMTLNGDSLRQTLSPTANNR
jgi:hypothetical protein